ncbi:MAG: hypothetical protein BWY02_02600 [bacterium ADurb.Bin157]|nr:MAG: hypothetical protein BWY02_02600 [bacterium ADurb.Bin157]
MKNKAQIEREILINANQAATADLYLLCQSERQQLNVVLAKLLTNHTLIFARQVSTFKSNAA